VNPLDKLQEEYELRQESQRLARRKRADWLRARMLLDSLESSLSERREAGEPKAIIDRTKAAIENCKRDLEAAAKGVITTHGVRTVDIGGWRCIPSYSAKSGKVFLVRKVF